RKPKVPWGPAHCPVRAGRAFFAATGISAWYCSARGIRSHVRHIGLSATSARCHRVREAVPSPALRARSFGKAFDQEPRHGTVAKTYSRAGTACKLML